jgi:hypothetical protein
MVPRGPTAMESFSGQLAVAVPELRQEADHRSLEVPDEAHQAGGPRYSSPSPSRRIPCLTISR